MALVVGCAAPLGWGARSRKGTASAKQGEAEGSSAVDSPGLAASSCGPPGAAVREHLHRLVAEHPDRSADAFMKVGDSATESRVFMHCFARDDDLVLGEHEDLRATIEAIRAHRVPGGNAFSRRSRAAAVGWRTPQLLRGAPSPVVEEIRELSPRFAVVLIGGNEADPRRIRRYERDMGQLVDRLLERGVMPILTTIPPRGDDPEEDAEVPPFNDVLRRLAAERALPCVDLHALMVPLPERGLASDGVHPNAPVRDGRAHGCDFGPDGLSYGMNQRNLVTLQRITELRRALTEAEPTE